ncbi:MAG: ABC transporter substrate-binding protein [bacterium]|nr:ABC transporter substrate-binding protein [bacterium]
MKINIFRSAALVLLLALFSLNLAQAQETNLVDACVSDYDPDTDYFPVKVEPEITEGFSVEYFNNYKVVTVSRPWAGATEDDAFQYVLVQCGTPAPEGFDQGQIVEVPVERVIALSTTYLPHIVQLGESDSLIGLDSFLYTNTAEVVEKIDAGELVEVGSGSTINVETVLDAEPDVVFAYGSGFPEYDTHPVLGEAGVFTALNGDLADTSLLARAEWIKFTALFFNQEAEANALFEGEVAAYEELVALTADLPDEEKPLVLWDAYTSFNEAWFVPGEEAYTAQLLRDAGAIYVLSNAPEVQDVSGSVPFDFEVVYEAGLGADVWFANAFMTPDLATLLAADERYADFRAFQDGQVYNNEARVNANGGNDFYETGVVNPHLILADLIHILHPDLLPDHELFFYRRLE